MKNLLITTSLILFVSALSAQHTLVLKTGDSMKGEVSSLRDGTVTFMFKGTTMSFKTSEVSVIYFEDAAPKTTVKDQIIIDGPSSAGGKPTAYTVPGRKLIKEPVINNLTQEHGHVVVQITVDKYGNVVKAEPGAPGTTTNSNYLHIKAKQAAESAKFDTSPTMPLETKGTITIEL